MDEDKHATTAQLREDMSPAASPLGTDDEAAGTTPSAKRVDMAKDAERKIGAAAKEQSDREAVEDAHSQRGSSAPYSKEDHMNEELTKQKEIAKVDGDPSEQTS